MKAKELKTKSAEELKGMVAEFKKERFNLRFQASTGEQASVSRYREVRKGIARAMTLINQKKEAK